MNDIVLKDADDRKAIVTDLDTSLMVEAGAGSGKTRSLVERMVALLSEGKCTVNTLAAVTFTKKAAAELKERFHLALEKELAIETGDIKRERLNQALVDLDQCFLGTIHSFCAALLRERPVEAALDPDFKELDQFEDTRLLDEVWEEYILKVQTQEDGKLDELFKVDVEPRELKDFYIKLTIYPEVKIIKEDVSAPNLKTVRAQLNNFLDWAEKNLPSQVPPQGWDGLQKILRQALHYRKTFNINDDIILLRLINLFDKKAKVTRKRWHTPGDAKLAQQHFDKLKENYINPALQNWREYRHKILVDFVLPAVKMYHKRKVEQSKLNYQDLLMLTADMLRENPEVRRYFQKRYTHLLVDEFQDTDPIQAEIMLYLTGEDLDENNWQKLVPKPGSLFIVGDPKQAIYRFRRADIDIYNEAKKLVSNSGGRLLYLTTNFRSVQAIGKWVNSVFKELLPANATPYQASFAGFDAVKKNSGGIGGVRKISIPKVNRHKQEQIANIDAGKIARLIHCAINGILKLVENATPGDFMVLLRNKKHMDIYARAMEKYGIPYQIAGGEGMEQSEETDELIKVLDTILNPEDPVKLAAALRGIFFGFSDRQLWEFKKAGGHFSIYSPVPDELNDGDKNVFKWAFGKLKYYRGWMLSLPASAALENIIKDLGVIPYTITGELGKSRSGYILQCLELAAGAERKGITSFSALVDYLKHIRKSEIEEEINITPWEKDCVKIMNLHKAKGLEAPVAFLAKPTGKHNAAPEVHISRTEDSPCGYFLVSKKNTH